MGPHSKGLGGLRAGLATSIPLNFLKCPRKTPCRRPTRCAKSLKLEINLRIIF